MRTVVGPTALTDLGQACYRGDQGGLYPGGSNSPTGQYLAAGQTAAAQVRPLGPDGQPSNSGRIGLVSIGMSNAFLEFNQFRELTHADAAVNPQVTLVNGAKPNYDATKIVDNQASYLSIVDSNLAAARVTTKQVQAVWLKEAIANEHEPFPVDAQSLSQDLDTLIAMLTAHFPNLRLVYISSRIYGGYAKTPLSPEPYAYDGGFAVKWAVAGRIATPTARPWVAWGPYLWANGTHARSDGLTWTPSDFGPDGTHPSHQGAVKVANMILSFFDSNSTTTPWFNARH